MLVLFTTTKGLSIFFAFNVILLITIYVFYTLAKKQALEIYNNTLFSRLTHNQQQRMLGYIEFLKEVNSEKVVSNLERKMSFKNLHLGSDEEIVNLYYEVSDLLGSENKFLKFHTKKILGTHNISKEDFEKIDENTIIFK